MYLHCGCAVNILFDATMEQHLTASLAIYTLKPNVKANQGGTPEWSLMMSCGAWKHRSATNAVKQAARLAERPLPSLAIPPAVHARPACHSQNDLRVAPTIGIRYSVGRSRRFHNHYLPMGMQITWAAFDGNFARHTEFGKYQCPRQSRPAVRLLSETRGYNALVVLSHTLAEVDQVGVAHQYQLNSRIGTVLCAFPTVILEGTKATRKLTGAVLLETSRSQRQL